MCMPDQRRCFACGGAAPFRYEAYDHSQGDQDREILFLCVPCGRTMPPDQVVTAACRQLHTSESSIALFNYPDDPLVRARILRGK
jgi:hypothetical protein